jgi:hypothetical protein
LGATGFDSAAARTLVITLVATLVTAAVASVGLVEGAVIKEPASTIKYSSSKDEVHVEGVAASVVVAPSVAIVRVVVA